MRLAAVLLGAVLATAAAGGRLGGLPPDAERARLRLQQRIADSDATVTVSTPFGPIRGFVTESNRSQHFLGVPFAAPPVGPLRWQPPMPTNWSTVLNASWFGPSCPQSSGVMTVGTTISEDCLYLNVYKPNRPAPPGGFAVMLFLYGGSWQEGSGSFPLYWADRDVSLAQNVIMITTNYRMRAFGFLASQSIQKQTSDGSNGNFGLQDQRAALKWAIRAAPSFGGNPKNVTLFGESAGAASVACHLVSPRSEGLFQRAAMESGPFGPMNAMPLNVSEVKFARLASLLGCAPPPSPAPSPGAQPLSVEAVSASDAVLDCLRRKNTSELLAAGSHTSQSQAMVDWGPTIDGVDLTDFPEVLAAAGKIQDVPILLGSNADEGTAFSNAPKDLNASGFMPFLQQRFGAAIAEAVGPLYPPAQYKDAWWAATHVLGDGLFSCPARQSSRWIANAPGRKSPVFLYFYEHVLELVDLLVPGKGCFHGSELAMVFHVDLALWTQGEQELASEVLGYWTRFAAHGNPNGGSDPFWPAYGQDGDTALALNVGANGTARVTGLKRRQCDAWDTVTVTSRFIFGE
ncbi:hypothetical protein FNF29_00152 [Cafeteria roenbergensis]|uniref:Carboxylic ester hydrolase n=1 Tax=Cafeteria roenbergensis TaxID=33653 RepID=A0A5A8CX43_CAFRO|nr:hypothetical protein FNF29_00152 [Cafeteria roenbergensis]|eukprot:KAA0157576.1 hypothetical protein FNF29_00152 [Cafeteria roenbergensis]